MFKAIACALTAFTVLSLGSLCFAGAKDITDAEYSDEVVKSKVPVVLEFWGYYCPDCWKSGPAINALADEYAGRIKVLTMNAEENPGTAAKFDTEKLPVFIYIKNGGVVNHITGPMTSKEELKGKLGLPEK